MVCVIDDYRKWLIKHVVFPITNTNLAPIFPALDPPTWFAIAWFVSSHEASQRPHGPYPACASPSVSAAPLALIRMPITLLPNIHVPFRHCQSQCFRSFITRLHTHLEATKNYGGSNIFEVADTGPFPSSDEAVCVMHPLSLCVPSSLPPSLERSLTSPSPLSLLYPTTSKQAILGDVSYTYGKTNTKSQGDPSDVSTLSSNKRSLIDTACYTLIYLISIYCMSYDEDNTLSCLVRSDTCLAQH